MVRAVQVLRSGRIVVAEREPEPLNGGVRLRVTAAGICGSDLALVAGKHPYARYPITPGHEVAASVLEAAPGVEGYVAGQRVGVRPLLACGQCGSCQSGRPNRCPAAQVLGVHLDGGMAEQMVVPASLLHRLPDSLDSDVAAMIEPTAVAVHACKRAGLETGDALAIIGAGVIGLLAMQVAGAWGAGPILAVDRVPERLAVARALGADTTADNRCENVSDVGRVICPAGFDKVLELVGRRETLADAAALARPGGVVVPVALPHQPIIFDFEPMYRRELTMRATRLYTDNDFEEAIALLNAGQVNPRPLITHHFSLEQTDQALALVAGHPDQAIKVIINP